MPWWQHWSASVCVGRPDGSCAALVIGVALARGDSYAGKV